MAERPCPALSLVVPVYGVEAYIGDCLDSIIVAPGFADRCELIVVDDGSTDESMAIVEQRCVGLTNVVIIRQPNAGLGAARNAGLAHATGSHVWFVDSDDEIYPNAISMLVERIERLAPDVIAFEFDTIGGTLERASYLAIYDRAVDPVAFMMSGRPPSPVQFYTFSREMIDRAGLRFHPSIYHEDALFTPLALVAAASLVRLLDTCYRYRLRPGSIMSLSRPEKHLADMMFIAETLGARAMAHPAGSRPRQALAREVGFALAGARHYAVRTDVLERRRVAPLPRLIAAGLRWSRHFPLRVLANYLRLLGLTALQKKRRWTNLT